VRPFATTGSSGNNRGVPPGGSNSPVDEARR
jgi:hypothetical protein